MAGKHTNAYGDHVISTANDWNRWHIFTGIGVYYDIVFIEYLRIYIASLNSKSPQRFDLIWNSTLSLPYIKIHHKDAARKS